ncbi:MAG: PASTA domain-containing protein [Oscillospiraceae bacterium]|jgi:stage V sporulation protein D (sporulation-specific penicillin-binding protein)|nr:PASTA domain-containing protein [Oscillospiraceae bacterium]
MKRGGRILKTNRTILARTFVLLTVCGIVAFVALSFRLYKIQISGHAYYEELATQQQTRKATITASRGTVYDANGKILAMSASVDTVFISPREMEMYGEDPELIASGLAQLLDVDKASVLEKALDANSWYKTIKTKVEQETAQQLREFKTENNLRSIHLEPDSKRYYPYGSLACQVIGFVGDDNYGLEGLEAQFDSFLTGTNGSIVRLKTERGADLLFNDFENYYDASDGNDITLTIDSNIQHYVEKHLAQAVADYDIRSGGACIAIDPKTGRVLALANEGKYDLNNYLQVSEEDARELELITDGDEYKEKLREALFRQWRNKALSDTYEPGSVFKIITLAMALEEGVVSEDDTFYCAGDIPASRIPGRTKALNCWKATGHGTQTLAQALQNSCNVALVEMGMKIGAEKFYEYIEAFGFFEKTRFDLPGEGDSIWWTDNVFTNPDNKSQLAAASFGQTFNITPMQLITAVSAAVNGGYLVRPHVVGQITSPDGDVIMSSDGEVVRQVISADTSRAVREILESVVSVGTGKNASVKGYRVGGKTGTSTKTTAEVEGTKEYIVSFCGVAPADDPQIVVLLLLDNPNPQQDIYVSGGAMAAPVVGAILSDVLPYMGIRPQYTQEEIAQLNIQVKNVVGMTSQQARETLEASGLSVRTVGGGGEVTGQLPAPGSVVSPGTQAIMYAGADVPGGTGAAPRLGGKTYLAAKKELEGAGLFIRSSGAPTSITGVTVTTQSVHAGESVGYGTVVDVVLIDRSTLGVF